MGSRVQPLRKTATATDAALPQHQIQIGSFAPVRLSSHRVQVLRVSREVLLRMKIDGLRRRKKRKATDGIYIDSKVRLTMVD
jgi:hypothetical protein